MMRVKIDFPEDIAKERVEEAKAWQPGMPLRWEAEEYHVDEKFEKTNEGIAIKTPHLEVELTKEEKARWVAVDKPIQDKFVAELEGKGLPGKELMAEWLRLENEYSSEQYAK